MVRKESAHCMRASANLASALNLCCMAVGQERGLRSGTLNTPAIVGLGKAFDEVRRRHVADARLLAELRSRFIQGITAIPGVSLNGDQRDTLPNTVSISIDGIEPLALMHALRRELTFSASSGLFH